MYCPAQRMLAYYFTKTLQGALFHKFREILMVRVSPYTMLKYITPYSIKDRVENIITGKNIPSKEIP